MRTRGNVLCLVIIALFIGLIIFFLSRPSSGVGGLRGGRIVEVRWSVLNGAVQQIGIYQDKNAAYSEQIDVPDRPFTTWQLSEAEWNAIEAIRAQWCRKTPTFRSLRADEAVYAINLSCGPGFAKHVEVPGDQLPPEFATLLTSVPSPP
jgi:hypothetical protein